ncbi:hypothetical protein EJK15_18750 [Nonomuraea basaltis]|nr:hypothetical protein EJK15_18750 [Nonomuraea basaltis]
MARTRARINPGLAKRLAAGVIRDKVERITEAVAKEAKDRAPDAKGWQATNGADARPSHRHADGQTIPANVPYQLPKMDYVRKGRDDDRRNPQGAGAWVLLTAVDLADRPRDPSLPLHQRINCFPADTPVHAPDVEAAFRAPYSGEMVRVTTRSGSVLTGTPNHPVLTNRGWIGLGALNVGDDLFRRRVGEAPLTGGAAVAPDVEHPPPLIGEVYRTLTYTGLTHRVGRVSVDFYGDRPSGDVDVVWAFGALGFHRQAVSTQELRDLRLAQPGPARIINPGDRLGRHFPCASSLSAPRSVGEAGQPLPLLDAELRQTHFQRVAAAPGRDSLLGQDDSDRAAPHAERFGKRLLRFAAQIAARYLLRRHTGRANKLRNGILGGAPPGNPLLVEKMRHRRDADPESLRDLGAGQAGPVEGGYLGGRDIHSSTPPRQRYSRPGVAALHASSIENLADALLAHPLGSGESGDTFPGEVAADDVIGIERFPWRGHVYTLQTSSGIYVANGFIVRNCECQSVIVPGVIAAATRALPARVRGSKVSAAVEVVFPRIGEAEFGANDTPGLHFLGLAGSLVMARRR